LQGAIGLSRLWQHQGKYTATRQVLAVVYDWFTEGFDTPDLQDAQTLLHSLSGNNSGLARQVLGRMADMDSDQIASLQAKGHNTAPSLTSGLVLPFAMLLWTSHDRKPKSTPKFFTEIYGGLLKDFTPLS
jgi:hypothetical protein